MLSFPYSPTLTSIHDYWKNHSLDKTDLCWQSNVQARLYHTSIGVHCSAPKHPGPRGATHASLSTVVSTGSGLLEAFSWLRGACWTTTMGPWGSWIPPWLVKILHKNSLRSSSIHSIKLSEETLASSGSPNQSTNTGACGGRHLKAESVQSGQGPQILPHAWWFSPCSLEKLQSSQLHHYC